MEKKFPLSLDRFKTGAYKLCVGDPDVEILDSWMMERNQRVLVIEFMYHGALQIQSVLQDAQGGSIYTASGRIKVWLELKREVIPFSPIQYTHRVTCQYPTHRVECTSGMGEVIEVYIPKCLNEIQFEFPIIVYLRDNTGHVTTKAVSRGGTNKLGMRLVLVENQPNDKE